jgi:hypothetical protein
VDITQEEIKFTIIAVDVKVRMEQEEYGIYVIVNRNKRK